MHTVAIIPQTRHRLAKQPFTCCPNIRIPRTISGDTLTQREQPAERRHGVIEQFVVHAEIPLAALPAHIDHRKTFWLSGYE
mgnify:FL=1